MQCYVEKFTGFSKITIGEMAKAKEIVGLLFPHKRAFGVDEGKVFFAQNMTMDEADLANPDRPIAKPIKAKTKPKKVKQKVKLKLVKAKPKKAKVKSKVVVKPKAKVGKTKLKVVKKPVAKKKVKKK